MDTLQLRIFVSAANTLNFSRTAEKFFISQPAVTHHIKMLEAALGAQLFNRIRRKITLSAEGLEFLPYAEAALATLSSAEMRLMNMAQGRTGHIRIAALSSTTRQLSECLASLYKGYPSIQADVDLLEGSEHMESVRRGVYDFYFSNSDLLAGAVDYTLAPIAQERLELYVNRAVAETTELADWSNIEKLPFVSIARSDAWLTSRIALICKSRGIKPNIINYYNRAEAAVVAVNAGVGIAILPGELKRLYHFPDIVTLPIPGDEAKVVTVFAWRREQMTTAGNIFKELVLASLPGAPLDTARAL